MIDLIDCFAGCLHGGLYLFLEGLPGVRIADIVDGAFLAGYIVMADNIPLGIEAEFLAQPSGEAHQGVHGDVVEASLCVGVADFNGNGIIVPVAGTISHFADGDTL